MGRRLVLLASALAIGAACTEPPVPPKPSPNCEQTYEFGNYGCTRLLVLASAPDGAIPPKVLLTVLVEPLGEYSGIDPQFGDARSLDTISMNLVRWGPGNPATDTLSVRIIARLLERENPMGSGLIGVDTVQRLLRVGRVGERAPVDTVHLTLERVPPAPATPEG